MEYNEKECPICGTDLHSINTNRFGQIAICRDCFNSLKPTLDIVAEDIVGRAKEAVGFIDLDSLKLVTLADYGIEIKP